MSESCVLIFININICKPSCTRVLLEIQSQTGVRRCCFRLFVILFYSGTCTIFCHLRAFISLSGLKIQWTGVIITEKPNRTKCNAHLIKNKFASALKRSVSTTHITKLVESMIMILYGRVLRVHLSCIKTLK